MRRFGDHATDLELDFASDQANEAVTDLLRACTVGSDGAGVDVDLLGELSLGDRLAALLALAGGFDGAPLRASMRCISCGEQLEALLPVSELLAYHEKAAAARVSVQLGEALVSLRVPTARDLARWGDGVSLERMVRELVSDDNSLPEPLPPDLLTSIERALAEVDPLVDFKLNTACPECGTSALYELDLQALALSRLRRERAELVANVHRLASAYHWSEAEILAVPPARRNLYRR